MPPAVKREPEEEIPATVTSTMQEGATLTNLDYAPPHVAHQPQMLPLPNNVSSCFSYSAYNTIVTKVCSSYRFYSLSNLFFVLR